jgi:glycosyltransferase involved in cell wall biosynthesis
MRILIATHHLGIVGGVETYLNALIPLLVSAGHEVGLLYEAAASGLTITGNAPGIPHWQCGGEETAATIQNIEEWRPDIVYDNGVADADLADSLASRFPTVLYAHVYLGTCISGTKCHSLPTSRPCSRRLGPSCLALYLPRGCGGRSPLTMISLYHQQRRREAVLAKYRVVLVASRHMASEYERHGVATNRLHIVPLFPPGSMQDPEPPFRRPRSDRILLLGRLTALKGAQIAAESVAQAAAQLARPLKLVVAGDGVERHMIEREVRRLRLPAEFLGWMPAERKDEEMRKADLLLVPSVWPEPFGLVGIEAGCVGLPAAAFAVGGIPDWLIGGESGELAPASPPTADGLSQAIVRSLSHDSHWQRLRSGAWNASGEFTSCRHLSRLTSVFEDVAIGPKVCVTNPVSVSVVVAAYKADRYLELALRDALAQTYSNIEVIVSDDAASAETRAIVDKLADPRLIYRANPTRLGVAENHRAAIAAARGQFISILNHDDRWAPEFLAELVAPLISGPDLVLAFCDHGVIDGDGAERTETAFALTKRYGRDKLLRGRQPTLKSLMVSQTIPMAMGCVFRRLALNLDALPSHAGPAYDLWLTYLLARSGKAAYYVPSRLSAWREHTESQTAAVTRCWAEGSVRCWEAVLSDPAFSAYRSAVRRNLSAGYRKLAALALLDADPSASRRAAYRAVLLSRWREVPKAAAIAGLSLLPNKTAACLLGSTIT